MWQNQQFWEAAFYQDVQKDIKALYSNRTDNIDSSNRYSDYLVSKPTSPRDNKEFSWQNRRSIVAKMQESTSLEIAAEQMRILNTISAEKSKELITQEENTIYSQAIHYANRMVYLLIPLDVASKHHKTDYVDEERTSNSITNR